MELEEIVKSWNIHIGSEFRGFRCGICQKEIQKAWHYKLNNSKHEVTVHVCDDCQKTTELDEGEYKSFSCDKCGQEIAEAYHVWEKQDEKLQEIHLCKNCGVQ